MRGIVIAIASISLFLALWQTMAYYSASIFLPGPDKVLMAFGHLSTVGDVDGVTLQAHIIASMIRVLLGFLVGAASAIPLGLLIGIKPIIRPAANPIIEPIRFIPPIAWIPLAIVLLGGLSRYVFIIWIGVFFPVLLNTIAGVQRTSPTLANVARTFGAKGWLITRKIIFPSALPEIMTGLRVGLGIGWMCIVAAEMIGGDYVGLGRLITKGAGLFQIDVVLVGMITIGLIGLAMNYIILMLEKRTFKWRVVVTT